MSSLPKHYVSTNRQIYEGLGPIEMFSFWSCLKIFVLGEGMRSLCCECYVWPSFHFWFFLKTHILLCMYWTFQQSSYVLSKVVKFFLFFVIFITSMHAVIPVSWTSINITGELSNQRTTGELNHLVLCTKRLLIHSFMLLWLLSALLMFWTAQFCLLRRGLYLFSVFSHRSLHFDEVPGACGPKLRFLC